MHPIFQLILRASFYDPVFHSQIILFPPEFHNPHFSIKNRRGEIRLQKQAQMAYDNAFSGKML